MEGGFSNILCCSSQFGQEAIPAFLFFFISNYGDFPQYEPTDWLVRMSPE